MARRTKPFFVCAENEKAWDAVYKGSDRDVLVFGPRGCGKTTLFKQYVRDAREKLEAPAIICSGSEIYISLYVTENDAFLENIGTASILVIDEVENLLGKTRGNDVLSLLVNARAGKNIRTVLGSDLSLEELQLGFPDVKFDEFTCCKMAPVESAQYCEFAKSLMPYYATAQCESIGEDDLSDIVGQIIAHDGGPREIDLAVEYAMRSA